MSNFFGSEIKLYAFSIKPYVYELKNFPASESSFAKIK